MAGDDACWAVDSGSDRTLCARLQSRLPVVEYGTCSDVRVPGPAAPRRLFDRLRPGYATPEHTPFEGALVAAHREHTRSTDDVVVVGGGYGITTVVAARRGWSVTVFEPDQDRRDAIRTTLSLNGVDDDRIALENAVVGGLAPAEASEKGFDPDALSTVAPDALPPCDVLELDCEGAELSILRGLDESTLPRVVAVEVHPIKLDGGAASVVPTLRDRGYAVRQRYTHDGVAVSAAAFRDLLEGATPGVEGASHQEYPPVVVAERTSQ